MRRTWPQNSACTSVEAAINYYEHHLGDYAAATGHLSWDEDMAYRRLIAAYYHHERPIPLDLKAACRLVRASSPAQRQAVETVLGEFFVAEDDGWHQKRCDVEIARFKDKQNKARRSAAARWGAQRTHTECNANASPDAMRTHTEGNAPSLQTPDPIPKTKSERFETPPPIARSLSNAEPPDESIDPQPTAAGRVCMAMRKAGLQAVNPGDPRLSALLEQGITEAEFVGVAAEAVGGGKGWAWVLTVVQRRRADAAAIAVAPGGTPQQRGPAAPNVTVPSVAAERTQALLREQFEKRQDRPTAEVLARLAELKRVAA